MVKKRLQALRDALTGSTRSLVVLVGAGISRTEPSSYPTANEFVATFGKCLLDRLSKPDDDFDLWRNTLQLECLPLERLSYFGIQECGARFLELFERCARSPQCYNAFHRLLAHAAATGRIAAIFTPNFDEFIEMALQSYGLAPLEAASTTMSALTPGTCPPHPRFYKVFSSWEDFSTIQDIRSLSNTEELGDTIPVFKLHGTLSKPETMAATVEHYQSWFLMPQRDAFGDYLRTFEGNWLVAGYSGRDEIFEWMYPPEYIVGVRSRPFTKLFWLMRSRNSLIAPRVREFHRTPNVHVVCADCDTLACEVLDESIKSSAQTAIEKPLTDIFDHWLADQPIVSLHTLAAHLALAYGRFADAIEIVRRGFRAIADPLKDDRNLHSYVRGLFYLSIAEIGLGNFQQAIVNLEQAISDWQEYKVQITQCGLDQGEWSRTFYRMKLYQGHALQARNLNVSDQLSAWELMSEAFRGLSSWHDDRHSRRNFESSIEFAEWQWLAGLFFLRGRDFESAERCFHCIVDVDVFNAIPIMRTRHLLGLALTHEAKAIAVATEPYSELYVRNEYDHALVLARAAKDSVTASFQHDVYTEILMLLGRASAKLGKRRQARVYFDEAAHRLRCVHGNMKLASEIAG